MYGLGRNTSSPDDTSPFGAATGFGEGTSAPTFSPFYESDPSNPSATLCYQTITSPPQYRGTSIEELRLQYYLQNRKSSNTSCQTSHGAPAAQSTSSFGAQVTYQQPTMGFFGTFGQPRQQQQLATGTGSSVGGTGVLGQQNPPLGFGGFSQGEQNNMQEFLEDFMRKLVLGEKFVDTQFHLFSARSSSGRVTKPRILRANNLILANGSKYFLDMLNSDTILSDPSLSDLVNDNDSPDDLQIEDYGYESDSDLEDDEHIPKSQKSLKLSLSGPKGDTEIQRKDSDESSDPDSGSVQSETFVMTPRMPIIDEQVSLSMGAASSATSEVQPTAGSKKSADQRSTHQGSVQSRHVLVKDTAFQTWYTMLNYLFTGKVKFLPLSSAAPGLQQSDQSSPARSLEEPRCSAKSMYRLACKVGLDQLRDAALAHIRSNLTEHNILKEISSSLVLRHAPLLEMELDMLHLHIASPTVVANFPGLVQRTIDGELPHGASIIIEMHSRLLKTLHPFLVVPKVPFLPTSASTSSSVFSSSVPSLSSVGSPVPVTPVIQTSQPSNTVGDDTASSHADKSHDERRGKKGKKATQVKNKAKNKADRD